MLVCVGCDETYPYSELVDGDWCEACWEAPPRIKCKRPLKHRPEFEGKRHCKACEAERIIKEITGEGQ